MHYGDSLGHITCSRSGEERNFSPEWLKHKAFGLVTNTASFQNTSLWSGDCRQAQEWSCLWEPNPSLRQGWAQSFGLTWKISKRDLLAHVAIPTYHPEEVGRCLKSKRGLMFFIFFNCKTRHPLSYESGSLRPPSLLWNSCSNEGSVFSKRNMWKAEVPEK